MTDLDEKIAAKRKAKKKAKKNISSRSDSNGNAKRVGRGQFKLPPALQSTVLLEENAPKKSRRRRGRLHRSGQLISSPETMASSLVKKRMVEGNSFSNDDVSLSEQTKFDSTSGGDHSGSARRPSELSSSARIKFGTAPPESIAGAKSPAQAQLGAVSVSTHDMSSMEPIKFGSSADGRESLGRRKKRSKAKVSSNVSEKYSHNSLPGAYSVTSSDISNSERLKFGAASAASSVAASMPGAHAAKLSAMANGERQNLDAFPASDGTFSMPGAHAAKSSDMSHSERLKFGASTVSLGTASMPGAHAAKQSEIKNSQKLNFGASDDSSGTALLPGAHAAKSSDMTNSERLKFGSLAVSSGAASISGAHVVKSSGMRDSERPMPGAHAAKPANIAHHERLKFGVLSALTGNAATMSAAHASYSSGDMSSSERLLAVSSTGAAVPGAHAASSTDMTNSERLKFGAASASLSTSLASMPGAHAERDVSNAEKAKFGLAAAASHRKMHNVAKMPGAHAEKHNIMSSAERVKFGTASSHVSAAKISGARTERVERVKFGANPSTVPGGSGDSDVKMPGARAERDLSSIERVKTFGAVPISSSAAAIPGSRSERSADISQAERVKFGPSSSVGSGGSVYSRAKMPGAFAERNIHILNAERVKFGAASSSSSAASLPGVQSQRSSEMSHAERVKFGPNSSVYSGGSGYSDVILPGAKPATAGDMSNAERIKFGLSSGVASLPGATPGTDIDVSHAERVKFGHGSFEMSGVGARTATSDDMSNAERVKFGGYSASSDVPGAHDTTAHELRAAARLKFGETSQAQSGGHDGNDIDTRAAEAFKFVSGSSAELHESEEPVTRGGLRTSDTSQNYGSGVHGGTDINTGAAEALKFGESESVARGGLRLSDTSLNYSQTYSEGEKGRERQDVVETASDGGVPGLSYMPKDRDHEHGGKVQDGGYRPYDAHEKEDRSHLNSGGREAAGDGWRSLCILCSCFFFVIVIGLSIALGISNNKGSTEAPPPKAIVTSKLPSASPTVSPTMPPLDFSWCYESNESKALEFEPYASLRSVLIGSKISTGSDFSDNESYQRKSLCWLSFGDRLSLNAFDPFLEQRYALATIFYTFNEPVSMRNEGWLSGKPECEWRPMVECDSRTGTTVSRLDLRSNDLQGALPVEMSVLQYVTYLDLSANQLGGDISNVIGGWAHLEELKLSSNNFVSVPSFLNEWKALKHFDISSNDIEGPIPDSLAQSTELVYLDIAANDFSGSISAELGNLTSLRAFYMHSNCFEGSMPQSICDLRNGELRQLSVDCGSISGEVECNLDTCCTVCGDYDANRDPFD